MVLHSKSPGATIPIASTQTRPGAVCTAASLIAQILLSANLLHTYTHVFRTDALPSSTIQQCVVELGDLSQCTQDRPKLPPHVPWDSGAAAG